MTEALTNAAVTDSLRALIREEIEARLADVVMLDTLEAQQYIAELMRPQIRAAVDQHETNLRMRVLSDPTVQDWYTVEIVYPPLPGEVAP